MPRPLLLVLLTGILFFPSCSRNASPDAFPETSGWVVTEGLGLDGLELLASREDVETRFGPAPEANTTDKHFFLNYRKTIGVDFLIDKFTNEVLEIRLNAGFGGALENGIRIGDSMDKVLLLYGGPKKTVTASHKEAMRCLLGEDRVLYESSWLGLFYRTHKFVDINKGIIFIFNSDKRLFQFVVIRPLNMENATTPANHPGFVPDYAGQANHYPLLTFSSSPSSQKARPRVPAKRSSLLA